MSRFLNGLLELADAHQVPLAGGDLAESTLAIADIVLVGAVPLGRAMLRSGASPGDQIYVTGWLGGAAAGLGQLVASGSIKRKKTIKMESTSALGRHLFPQPRIAQGLSLQRRRIATAAIDLSDGLSTDLAHVCEESGVAAEVDAALIPIHPHATLNQALHGGEDYELLFTASASKPVPRSVAGVAITRIGRILKHRRGQPAVTIISGNKGEPLEPRGWQHFS
jgi:thiamine-monophosphate kinase